MTKDGTSVLYQMCCHPSLCVPFLNVYIQADWRTKRGVASGLQAQRYAHEVPDAHPGLSDSRLLELAESHQQVAWSEKQAEAEQWTQAAAVHVPWAYWFFFFFFFDRWFYSVFLLMHVYLKFSMLCMQSYITFVLFFLFFPQLY